MVELISASPSVGQGLVPEEVILENEEKANALKHWTITGAMNNIG